MADEQLLREQLEVQPLEWGAAQAAVVEIEAVDVDVGSQAQPQKTQRPPGCPDRPRTLPPKQ
jgi:hypothetical protein